MSRIPLLWTILVAQPLLFAGVATAQLNTTADDYAAAFRTTPDGMELWFTSGRASSDGRDRAIYIATCSDTGFSDIRLAPEPSNTAPDVTSLVLNGTPDFAVCDKHHCFLTSNRRNGAGYTGNDIYELRFESGAWKATRIDAVNSSEWDDSPALSPDGTRLYFASDRVHPGTRRADLYMSELHNGEWSEPRPLVEVNTSEFSEETPFVGEDGFLYYSTNRSGDFDIWRTRLNDRGLPEDAGVPVAGINQKGSDQTHPLLSPGAGFLLYSTNADGKGGRKDFDITWVKLQRHEPILELDVRKRRRQTTERVRSTIHLTIGSRRVSVPTSASEPTQLRLDTVLGTPTTPATDARDFTIIAAATPDSNSFVSAVDTLVGSRTCSQLLPHTIFLWDTATYYEQRCIDTFPIKKVQYFVTGYWCPTTKRFASYLECPTLFLDSGCMTPACPPGDLYTYRVGVVRAHSECIDYAEFDRKGSSFASEVDDAIEQHLKAMESAFSSACMRRTIAEHRPVRVVVEGFTDPRGYGSDCHYFGPTIDITASGVQVPPETRAHLHHDARMKDYGAQGNQLLSELRAYNLASLLDKVWTERIPQYRELKEQGLLTTIAIGRAISQDDIPFEQRRSAQVSIAAESDAVIIPGQVPPPGQRVVLCQMCR